MKLTKKQIEEFEGISKPMIKWLNDNCHPHVTIIVDNSSSELVEGITSLVTQEFIND